MITDDPYEYIVYSGEHIPIADAAGDGGADRHDLLALQDLLHHRLASLGYAIATPERTDAIRKVHDFLTVGAPAPVQDAAAIGYAFDDDYYTRMSDEYRERRDFLGAALRSAGFRFTEPQGAYYFFTDFSALSDLDDVAFATWLTREIGIATVPGSSFYRPGAAEAKRYTRFAFCKKMETLGLAVEKLARL